MGNWVRIAVSLVIACSTTKPDSGPPNAPYTGSCDQLAKHIIQISKTNVSTGPQLAADVFQLCKGRKLTNQQVDCMLAAGDIAQAAACMPR
jgi:hypothetical protein